MSEPVTTIIRAYSPRAQFVADILGAWGWREFVKSDVENLSLAFDVLVAQDREAAKATPRFKVSEPATTAPGG